MTEQQLKTAKVLDKAELPNGQLVLLDMRTVGVVNVFPQFAVYELRNDTHYFVAGSNDERNGWEAFEKAAEKRRKHQKH